jgi:hypothetical protein
MTSVAASVALLRWSPTFGSGKELRELAAGPFGVDELPMVFKQIASELTGCATLIVRVAGLESEGVLAAAFNAVRNAGLSCHICLATSRTPVAALDAHVRTNHNVGLLLDNVDGSTPLAELMHEAIEAIRFDPAFTKMAARHLRSECILEAMLGLARNAGLCTLGPAPDSAEPSSSDLGFDYVR